jgi:hypothetical protein
MSSPRRRLLRPVRPPVDDGRRQAQLTTRRLRLESEQQSLKHWMSRLRRAFHAVERQQLRVTRLEREIARLEQG